MSLQHPVVEKGFGDKAIVAFCESFLVSKTNINLIIYNYNLGQNIRRLFHFSAKFVFTTSETELDYYHQKVSARVASRVAERLKT